MALEDNDFGEIDDLDSNSEINVEDQEELPQPISELDQESKDLSEQTESFEDKSEQPITINICSICRERNLTDQTQFNNCSKCGQIYCLHYSSTIDPQYCTSCLYDVSIKEEIISKTETHYNEETDQLYTRTRKAKRITLGGMHWLFVARKINKLTDLELDLAIEYHRDILSQMMYERDERRSQKAHRNAGKKLPISFSNSVVQTDSQVEVKKTKIKQATKADPATLLANALKILQQNGLSIDEIAKMAARGVKK